MALMHLWRKIPLLRKDAGAIYLLANSIAITKLCAKLPVKKPEMHVRSMIQIAGKNVLSALRKKVQRDPTLTDLRTSYTNNRSYCSKMHQHLDQVNLDSSPQIPQNNNPVRMIRPACRESPFRLKLFVCSANERSEFWSQIRGITFTKQRTKRTKTPG